MKYNSVWIWSANEFSLSISPETIVYTMRMSKKNGDVLDIDNLLCDTCWLTPEGVKSHFWSDRKYGEVLKYIKMPFHKYIQRNKKEIRGMNFFWDIGRMEFISKYSIKWNYNV